MEKGSNEGALEADMPHSHEAAAGEDMKYVDLESGYTMLTDKGQLQRQQLIEDRLVGRAVKRVIEQHVIIRGIEHGRVPRPLR